MIARIFGAIMLVSAMANDLSAGDEPGADFAKATVENLRSKEVDVRRKAAGLLRDQARERRMAALPALIDLLMTEKDGQVRLAVLDTITTLGPDAATAIPALVHTLRTSYGGQSLEESHQDYRSALALAAIGRPAVEGLRGLLKERKENVRAEAIMALGRIGPDAAAAISDLIPLLGDEKDRIRREASQALGRIGQSAIGPLIDALVQRNVVIRTKAIEGLGLLAVSDDRVYPALLKTSHDETPEIRAAAVKALSSLKLSDDELAPIAAEPLRDEDESVRIAMVNGLVGRRTVLVRLVPELEALLTSKNAGVAHHAAFLLGKSGPVAIPGLLNALRRDGSRIDEIAEALARIGRPAVAPLSKAIESTEPRVRQGAARALGQIRPLAPGIVPILTAGLADPDLEVRKAFLTALGDLGPRAIEAAPAVRAMLRDHSPELRGQAIDVLFQSAPRDERLLDDLMPLLGDVDSSVQRRSLDAIRALGPIGRKALPVVIKKLQSRDADVRLAAAQLVEGHAQGATEAIPALISLLDDPAPKIQILALQTLGKIGKPAQGAFLPLTSLLGDENAEVREAAIATLGSLELEAEVIRPHLAKTLRDVKAEVRRAASRAVQRLGPQGVLFVPDIILMAASKENARSVDRLLRPFERTGPDPRSVPELVKLLDQDQVPVRLLAIKFLGLAGSKASEAIPALERIREDPSEEVRQQAKVAWAQISDKTKSH